jgi:hypothetical protein
MFSIPLISAVPIPGIFGGTILVPGVGAFLAMMLMAALVGSALGVLRQATTSRPGSTALHLPVAPPAATHDDHHEHREAA